MEETKNNIPFNLARINNFTIHVNEPTRITETSSTVLDQFLTNIQDDVKEVAIHPPITVLMITLL